MAEVTPVMGMACQPHVRRPVTGRGLPAQSSPGNGCAEAHVWCRPVASPWPAKGAGPWLPPGPQGKDVGLLSCIGSLFLPFPCTIL
jgi:hypothetical protein